MTDYHANLLSGTRPQDSDIADIDRRLDLPARFNALDERIQALEQAHLDTTTFLVGQDPGVLPEDGLIPLDDGTPPSPPANVVLTLGVSHEIDVTWDKPLIEDWVAKSVVEVTPFGSASRLVDAGVNFAALTELTPNVLHTIRVKFVDRWGHESSYSSPQTATPTYNAPEQINFDVLAAAGRITGLLPDAHLDTITDPTKLAEGTVKAIANAANKNKMPFNESRPAADDGSWSTVGLGRDSSLSSALAIITDTALKKWYSQTSSATGAWHAPYGPADYGQKVASYYCLSASAWNNGGSSVSARLSVVFYASDGTVISEALGSYQAVAAGQTVQLYVNFQVPTNTTSIQYRFWLQSGTLRWSDLMLEQVGSLSATPSAYTVPALYTGAIGANLIAGLDVVGVNGIFGHASITDAVIANLKAGKILTDAITTETLTLALSGKIQAGATIFDTHGVTLPVEVGFSTPSVNRDYKISAADHSTSMSFYLSDTLAAGVPASRGVAIRADGGTVAIPGGGGGSVPGEIVLQATRNGVLDDPNSMLVEFQADLTSYPNAFYQCNIILDQGYEIFPQNFINPSTIAASSTITWTFAQPFALNQPPRWLHGYYALDGAGHWNPNGAGGVQVYIDTVSYTALRSVNSTTSSKTIYWSAWQ